MSHENSQFDIPAIQLRESKTQPRVSLSREIGEAQITHTIFGRAKVRIIRKGDQARRNMILAAITMAALAVAAWQGWFTSLQTEPVQSTTPASAVNTGAQVNVPASLPEGISAPAIPPLGTSEPVVSPAAANNSPAAIQKVAPQQTIELKDAGQKTPAPAKVQPKPVPVKPKPVPAEPLKVGKPTIAPAAANKDTLKNQADMPVPARQLPAKRPVTPAVATSPAAQPAASSPAAVAPPGKEDFTIQSPVDDKQLSAPISTPGK